MEPVKTKLSNSSSVINKNLTREPSLQESICLQCVFCLLHKLTPTSINLDYCHKAKHMSLQTSYRAAVTASSQASCYADKELQCQPQSNRLSPDSYSHMFPQFAFSDPLSQTPKSQIWLGYQKGTSATLALKITSLQKNSRLLHQERQKAFLQEHQLDRMVKVLQIRENNSQRLLAMEYCRWSLADLLPYYTCSPTRSYTDSHLNFIVFAFKGMLQAVEQLHQKGFVHRDLKLDNFMVDSNFNILLNDFELVTQQLVVDTAFSGTLDYMAPERLTKNGRTQPITSAVDIWSLGIILYELFAGTTPFNGSNPQQLLQNIYEGYISPKRIPAEAMQLIRQMLPIRSDKRAQITKIKGNAFLQRAVDIDIIRGAANS